MEGIFTNTLYDETPMKVRVRSQGEEQQATVLPVTAKLLRVEHEVGVLARDMSTGRHSLVLMYMPCPVMALEKGTGALLKHC